jgi:hypothetical protein
LALHRPITSRQAYGLQIVNWHVRAFSRACHKIKAPCDDLWKLQAAPAHANETNEAANCGGLFEMTSDYKSPPVAMMPPTVVVAAVPTVVMATAAAMAPPMPTLHLDDGNIGGAESTGCCGGHCRRRASRSKATERSESNKSKSDFHGFLPVAFQNSAHSKKLNVNRG